MAGIARIVRVMTHYTIAALEIDDFARIRHVRITPGSDSYFILIAGNNAQGKTTIMNAITSVLAGKTALPPMPVRKGAKLAVLKLDIVGDDGTVYKLKRTITPTGETTLEIRGPEGIKRSPQTWLDKLIGERFLDPMAFLDDDNAEKRKKQRATLLALAGVDVDGINTRREALFTTRRDVGRDRDRAKGEHESLPAPPAKPAEARPVALVSAELAEIEDQARQQSAARSEVGARRSDVAMATRRINDARAALAQAEHDLSTAEHGLAAATLAAETWGGGPDLSVERAKLQAEIGRSETMARWQSAAQAMAARFRDSEARLRTSTDRYDALTEEIAALDSEKLRLLAAAEMPVPGLTVTDDGIMLDGVPFEQASQAQRIRVSLVISMRLSKEIRDVLVRDGAHLDNNMLAALKEAAEDLNCRVWVERVGERDAGAIIMRDGAIATDDA